LPAEAESRDQIRAIVDKIIAVTLGSSPEDIAALFHEDVVFQVPDFGARVRGRQACLESYRDFRNAAQVHEVHTEPPQIDVCGSAAVAVYAFDIHYSLDKNTCRESGRDWLVLILEDGRWLVA
jgi:uncharacterized protein (TIGR02246 family)